MHISEVDLPEVTSSRGLRAVLHIHGGLVCRLSVILDCVRFRPETRSHGRKPRIGCHVVYSGREAEGSNGGRSFIGGQSGCADIARKLWKKNSHAFVKFSPISDLTSLRSPASSAAEIIFCLVATGSYLTFLWRGKSFSIYVI